MNAEFKGCSMTRVMKWMTLLLLLGGCAQNTTSVATPVASSATPLVTATTSVGTSSAGSAKEVAGAAFKDFGGRLKKELLAAVESGGPVQAVEVCHTRAPQIAQEVSSQTGLKMGRSSHRTRNSDNAPSPAVAAYLEKYSQTAAKDVPVEVMDQGEFDLVIAPIATGPLCLKCHGDPNTFAPELKEALAQHYPDDQATGFQAGELRGVFWAEVKR
jgi:hypothetical protein